MWHNKQNIIVNLSNKICQLFLGHDRVISISLTFNFKLSSLNLKKMYIKEIIQFISLPVMIFVAYKVIFWLYQKLEKKGFLK